MCDMSKKPRENISNKKISMMCQKIYAIVDDTLYSTMTICTYIYIWLVGYVHIATSLVFSHHEIYFRVFRPLDNEQRHRRLGC